MSRIGSVSLLIGACDPMRRSIRVCRPALGTLTWLGAATHQANGLWLRDRYVAEHGLLPSTLAAGDVVARSTPFPRCVQSCQNLLLGLYPPEHRGGPGDDNHTTPVGSTSRQHEPMYGVWYTNADDCPRMRRSCGCIRIQGNGAKYGYRTLPPPAGVRTAGPLTAAEKLTAAADAGVSR